MEVEDQRPVVGSCRLVLGGQRLKVGSWRMEVGVEEGWRLEVGRLEVRAWRSKVGG